MISNSIDNPRPTRRHVLGSLATLLAIGAWPGARAAEQSENAKGGVKPIRFVSLNDLHHEDETCDAWMEALFRQIGTTENAAMCFCIGDLANSGKPTSLRAIQRLAPICGMPFYPSPGNHDLDESPVDGHYESIFPGRRNYVIQENGWQFVVIDSTEGTKWRDVTIAETTLDWLDETLPTLDPLAPLVLLTHFPLASEVRMCPQNAEAVLARLIGHNLRGVFGGHFHGRTHNARGNIGIHTCACVSRVRNNHDQSPEKGYYVVNGDAKGVIQIRFVEFTGA
jgi:hypothetical protein